MNGCSSVGAHFLHVIWCVLVVRRLETVLGRLTILNRIRKGRQRLTVDHFIGPVRREDSWP